ncbi:MAG: hypothetical protein HYY45_02190 [Deltaproteobacteria bacterium]|nr:hypothetical protein [Deltaproteobacteria bacterium]
MASITESSRKSLIKIVATGGTIANTREGRIPIQQVITDIRKSFPETVELLDSVHFEVLDLVVEMEVEGLGRLLVKVRDDKKRS